MSPSPSPAIRLGPRAALVALLVAACAGPAASPVPTPRSPSPVASPPAASPADPSGPIATTSRPTAGPPAGESPPAIALEPVVDGLDAPLAIAYRPDDPAAVFVVEQVGRIRIVRDGRLVDRPFLDIADQVTAGGERGLLGLAFHPDPDDGRAFVYYTSLEGDQLVTSFRTDPADRDRADPSSEVVLLRMADEFGNHNGGALAFGPDGFLYVSTGDGGGGGDPLDSGRRLDTLLAKVLRLDVDVPDGADPPYAVPPDNPFVDEARARPEIWLTGLRNPWRMNFDRATGDLWIGDVGQGAWEEIDVARAGTGGLDFGWNTTEGFECYPPGTEGCATGGLVPPVAAYGHDVGCAVTGGSVYRGAAQAALAGWYVLADYCSGRFWALDPTSDGPTTPVPVLESGRSISAIAEDAASELLATDLATGEVLHIVVAGG